MSIDADPSELDERVKWSPWAIAAAALLVLLFGLIAVAGLRGCLFVDPRDAAMSEEEKKKKEEAEKKKKPDFEIAEPRIQPAEPETPFQYAKPGHWVTATQRIKANYREFVGRSLSEVTNKDRRPHAVPYTPFIVRASRPVALAKGAPKVVENTVYIPPANGQLYIDVTLEERGLGSSAQVYNLLSRMPSYQYHFVVLAKELSRYSFIKSLDSVDVPYDGETHYDDTEDALHYRVVLLDATQTLPLSDNPLTWSSIAYMLWDEVDPQLARMTPEQERALVDWIHWGGQLIISGPDSLDLLQGTFLEEYLPVTNGGARIITADDLQAFNEHWMISTVAVPGKPLVPTTPWSGITLEPVKKDGAPEAATQASSDVLWETTGGLVAERRVGRGRIVVSAMQLSERDLINWRSGFESFFNAGLLRRPPREYREGGFGDLTLAWDDTSRPELAGRRLDARLTSNLFYMARDLGVTTAYSLVEVDDEFSQYNQFGAYGKPEKIQEYRPPEHVGGLGAWNDFNATANAARNALREAAGVEVPGHGFVVVCLAAYLLALVPLNWLVFHTLGRVEWAWIAAPIIAVAGTFTVINRAQLDIGFVRAQTEIGLLELQPNHSRGHLTRYTAMYTSLSTTYDLEFDNLTTLAAPFPRTLDDPVYRTQRAAPVDFQRYDTVRLAGLPIASNSTGFVHSEQMFAQEGAIEIEMSTATRRPQVVNRSKLALQSAAVVQKVDDEEVRGMWIGDFAPGRSAPLALVRLQFVENGQPFDKERAADARLHPAGRLNLEPMFRLALDPAHLEKGETRLVARVDEILPGETISPAASQVRGATLVVAHLDYGDLPMPQPDRNTRQDIKVKIESGE